MALPAYLEGQDCLGDGCLEVVGRWSTKVITRGQPFLSYGLISYSGAISPAELADSNSVRVGPLLGPRTDALLVAEEDLGSIALAEVLSVGGCNNCHPSSASWPLEQPQITDPESVVLPRTFGKALLKLKLEKDKTLLSKFNIESAKFVCA